MADKDLKSRLEDLLADSQELGEAGNDSLPSLSRVPEVPQGKRTSLDNSEPATIGRGSRVPGNRRSVGQMDLPREPLGNAGVADMGLRQYVTPFLRWWWLILIALQAAPT